MAPSDEIGKLTGMEPNDAVASLYEDAPCGLLATDMDGTLLRANRTFLEWTGYDLKDLVGVKRMDELLTAGGRIYYETHYAPLLRMQGFVREIAIDIVARDGTRLPAFVNSRVKSDPTGTPVEIHTAVLDASHRREYEQELLRARERAELSEVQVRELAETLQKSLIPPEPPAVPRLDVGAAYRPAGSGDEVGGDFYDVFEIARDQWALAIGDVIGKGAQAATVTALVRYTIRAAAIQASSPISVLRLLNDAMLRQQPDSFCTVAYGGIDLRDGLPVITMGSAGHPLPLLVSPEGVSHSVGRPGTVIGVVTDPEVHNDRIELEPGNLLIFFTDGATEGRAPGGEFFGEDRVEDWVVANRRESAASIAEGLVDAVVEFQRGSPRDDMAVLVLKNA